MSERVSPRGDAGEEGGRDDYAMAPVGDPDPQESVEAILVLKAAVMGRVLSAREDEYLRLQVERNDLVLRFPHAESRGEEVLKTLQRIKNRLKKLAKGRPVDDVLKLPLRSDQPKTAAERTSAKRRNLSKEARDKEREDDRKRKASPEELERGRKRKKALEELEKAKERMKAPDQLEKAKERMKAPEQLERGRERKRTPEEVEKAKVRMKTPDQVEKAKVRMKTPDQVEKAKVRMRTPEQLERGRERKRTPEEVEKAKVRMSLPANKEKDAARKKERRRVEKVEREKEEERPRVPRPSDSIVPGGGRGDLHVKFPANDLKEEIERWWNRKSLTQPSVQGPTYSLDQPLRIRVEFTCYPPPTIVWLKDGKVLARDTVKYVVKEGVNEATDCKKERVAPKSKLRFRVESFYRYQLPTTSETVHMPGAWGIMNYKEERKVPPQLMQQGWSDFIIPEPKISDEGIYEVRVFNDFGVLDDFIQVSFKPLLLKDISMRATTFSADNLERQVLRSGDYFQLQVEASGGRVEWMKDGQIVPKVVQPYCDRAGHLVNVDQPDRTQLLEPGTYPPGRPTQSWNDFVPSEQHFPPNRCQSFLGGRCEVKDAGVYQARVVSAAGECLSSPITVEVEPGPEWEGVTTGFINSTHREQNRPCLVVSTHYGARMTTTACENWEEAHEYDRNFGKIIYLQKYGALGTHIMPYRPTGWIEGTVGSWEVRKSQEESDLVEKEGKQVMHADAERRRLFNWVLKQPYAVTKEDTDQRWADSMQFEVSDAVRETLFRMHAACKNYGGDEVLDLSIQLEANRTALCEYLSDEPDWPSHPLIKSAGKQLVGTTLNHTWESHLKWELEMAEDWAESFDEFRSDWTIRWHCGYRGFRSKRRQSNLHTSDSDTSSSDSMSSSDSEEEERSLNSARSLDWKAESLSVRLGQTCLGEQQEETGDDEEEEEEENALSRLEGLLLDNHDEDQDMDFLDISPSLDMVQEDNWTATPNMATEQGPEKQV